MDSESIDYDNDALYLADERYHSATTLYRYYQGETLLYIGIAKSFSKRDFAHWKASKWRHDADRADLVVFPTEYLARCAEMAAIIDEKPPFNTLKLVPLEPTRVGDQWYLKKMGGLIGEHPRTVFL